MQNLNVNPEDLNLANRYLTSSNDLELEKVLRNEGFTEIQIGNAANIMWDILFHSIEYHVNQGLSKKQIIKKMKEVDFKKLTKAINFFERKNHVKIKSGFNYNIIGALIILFIIGYTLAHFFKK